MFNKILIANRGEIAVRILRACRELGIRSVAVFSEADRACEETSLVFIGPPAEAMEALGSKTAGRQLARRSDVPTVPGANDPIEKPDEAQALARSMGYPVLLKAVSGGGGKGMRVVAGDPDFASAWRDASSEALNAFGDARLYLEKYLENPRHIEIQIFADSHGRVVSLGERECSVQRRHQKVIEEAPSSIVTPELRKKMGDAAVRLARAGRYTNAGTVEFLVDAHLNFYFLEVNTRLQVEHPVTEQVTGLDLVKLQIAIAAGHRLPFAWESITPRGHAMEVRLYAEDPENNFFPSPGKILSRHAPSGPGIRLDEGIYEGWTVPNDYDPLLSKLIAWGNSREETIARLRRALEEYAITGIKTNAGLFRRILSEPDFLRGEIHTRWLDELLRRPRSTASHADENQPGNSASDAAAIAPNTVSILLDGQCFEFGVTPSPDGKLKLQAGTQEFTAEVIDPRIWSGRRSGHLEAEGRQQIVAPMPGKVVRLLVKEGDHVEAGQGLLVVEAMKMQNEIRSPKSGTVERVLAREGQPVNAGEVLAIVA